MERICPKCGNLVSAEGLFCSECGAKFEDSVDLSKPSEPASAPAQNYAPAQNSQPYMNSSNQAQFPQYPQSYNAPAAEE